MDQNRQTRRNNPLRQLAAAAVWPVICVFGAPPLHAETEQPELSGPPIQAETPLKAPAVPNRTETAESPTGRDSPAPAGPPQRAGDAGKPGEITADPATISAPETVDSPADSTETAAASPTGGAADTETGENRNPVDETGPDTTEADDAPTAQAATQAVPESATALPDGTPTGPKPPVAKNVDLSQPTVDPESEAPALPTADGTTKEPPATIVEADDKDERPPKPTLILLGSEVVSGTSARLSWSPEHSFAGIDAPTPVLVVNGQQPGPVLCLTAAVHGDELNGIEIVRRVLYELDPKKLSGAVIGVPIVNLQGFRRGSRYLPDRRDLNRFFPGNPDGSSAARIAHSFFTEVISHCDALVDIHTGSFHRTNLPQLRADLANPEVVKLTQGFGSTVVLQSDGAAGTLRLAAVNVGIPAVTLETGEPQRVQPKAVSHGTKGIQTLLNEMGMVRKTTIWGHREPIYYRSTWIRANQGGVLFSKVAPGARVEYGELLGTITDPITNVQSEVRATVTGRVLGMALNQFVMPGFAAFHIGIEKPVDELAAATDPARTDAATQSVTELTGEQAPVPEQPDDSEIQTDIIDHLDDSE